MAVIYGQKGYDYESPWNWFKGKGERGDQR